MGTVPILLRFEDDFNSLTAERFSETLFPFVQRENICH
jgi:hypothetical protein